MTPIQFAPLASYAVGGHHAGIAIGDLNGDNNPDLVVTNVFLGSVSVLTGNGDGTFQPQAMFATGDRPLSVSIADLDGDNIVKLAVANANSNSVSILRGNGRRHLPGTGSLCNGTDRSICCGRRFQR